MSNQKSASEIVLTYTYSTDIPTSQDASNRKMLSIKSSTLPNFSKCYQNYSQSKSLVKRKAFQESPSLKSNVRNTSISTRIKCETSLEQESTQSVNVEFYSDQLVKLLEQKSTYRWKDSIVNYVKSGEGPPLLLIHGFGASIGHWRK